jgi:hypothetical protein
MPDPKTAGSPRRPKRPEAREIARAIIKVQRDDQLNIGLSIILERSGAPWQHRGGRPDATIV